MKYCVKKNTTIVIDGQELATYETMIKNAKNMGFTEDKVEIIAEEEFEKRLTKNIYTTKKPSEIEQLRSDIDYLFMEIGVDL